LADEDPVVGVRRGRGPARQLADDEAYDDKAPVHPRSGAVQERVDELAPADNAVSVVLEVSWWEDRLPSVHQVGIDA
jgi:hypothetical protein